MHSDDVNNEGQRSANNIPSNGSGPVCGGARESRRWMEAGTLPDPETTLRRLNSDPTTKGPRTLARRSSSSLRPRKIAGEGMRVLLFFQLGRGGSGEADIPMDITLGGRHGDDFSFGVYHCLADLVSRIQPRIASSPYPRASYRSYGSSHGKCTLLSHWSRSE